MRLAGAVLRYGSVCAALGLSGGARRLMRALLEDAQQCGARIHYRHRLRSGSVAGAPADAALVAGRARQLAWQRSQDRPGPAQLSSQPGSLTSLRPLLRFKRLQTGQQDHVRHMPQAAGVSAGPVHKELVFEGPGGRRVTAKADVVVNCAGLHAQEASACLQGMPAQHVPPRHLARGCYFVLRGGTPTIKLLEQPPQLVGCCRTLLFGGRRGCYIVLKGGPMGARNSQPARPGLL